MKKFMFLIFCIIVLVGCQANKEHDGIIITYNSGILEQESHEVKTTKGIPVILPKGEDFWTTEDKVFVGWTQIENSVAAYKAGESFTSFISVTLFAVWKEKKQPISITLYSNLEGRKEKVIETTTDSVVSLPDAATLWDNGAYVFKGWSLSSDGEVEYDVNDDFSSHVSISLYAIWIPADQNKEIKITLNSGLEGQTSKVITTTQNAEIEIPSGDELWEENGDKYSFVGWLDSSGRTIEEGSCCFDADTTLSAEWKLNPCITYDANGGSGDRISQYAKKGSKITLKKNLGYSKENYSFISWNTMADGSGEEIFSDELYVITSDVTFYAVWKKDPIVEYYDGDTLIKTQSFKVTTGAIIEGGESLTKEGYIFYSWNTDLGGSGSRFDVGSNYSEDSNLKLYAQWQREYPDLCFDFDSATYSYEVSAADMSITDVEIPSSYNGYKVSKIKDSGFKDCEQITSLSIPDSVTSIGSYSFSGCTRLISIDIPDSVVKIGEGAFKGCERLSSLVLPSKINLLEDYVFNGCKNIKTVLIPSDVTKIGKSVFSNCKALESIEIPDSVKEIGENAFYGCSGLISVKLPKDLKELSSGIFYECGKLISIKVPSGVTKIGGAAFLGCYSLKTVELPSNLESIGAEAFASCSITTIMLPNTVTSLTGGVFYASELVSIDIPASISAIPNNCFSYCQSLTSVTIEDGISSIGEKSFYHCSALANVTIGKGISRIKTMAFFECKNLTNINFSSTKADWDYIILEDSWRGNSAISTVTCTDGVITL